MSLYEKFKGYLGYGFKYGKVLGAIWLISMLIIAPIIFCLFGWQALVAYLICKLTGACPL